MPKDLKQSSPLDIFPTFLSRFSYKPRIVVAGKQREKCDSGICDGMRHPPQKMLNEEASVTRETRKAQASMIAATPSPKAKHEVRPGESMPNKFTTPAMP